MVCLTTDLILRYANSKGTKLRSEDSTEIFLKKLTHLNLTEKGIDEIGNISICCNLSVIYLYDNQLSCIENLSFAVHLTHLYLQNNFIERLQGLSNCTNIEKLYLTNNAIVVVEGLHTLVNLRELCIDSQNLPPGEKLIFDPRTLVNISRTLETLNVAGNRLDSVKELRCMTFLRQLNISNNKLGAMKDLADTIGSMAYLHKLDSHGNPLMKKAKYRDRVITMNENIRILDGKEVPESLKTFLRNWKSAKDKQKKMLIDQAMIDGIPNLPPLQKVPPNQKYRNSHVNETSAGKSRERGSSSQVAPPIKRGMRSGQKELEHIMAKSRHSNMDDESFHAKMNSAGDLGGTKDVDPSLSGLNNDSQFEEMPLLALTDPQSSQDSNFARQKTNVMNIEVRTPDIQRKSSAKSNSSSRKASGQMVPLKPQVMDLTSLGNANGAKLGDSVSLREYNQFSRPTSQETVMEVGFDKDDVKLDL